MSRAGEESAVVAIDVGGTKIALALVAGPQLKIVERKLLPTPPIEASGAALLDQVATEATGLAGTTKVAGVGLAICELVGGGGAIGSGFRIAWQGLSVADSLSRIAPLVIEADVHAAAAAEARLGSGRPFRSFLYVGLGTGVSACWVVGGQPHKGVNGHALVLASSPLSPDCDTTLEEIAGGEGMLRRYRDRGGYPRAVMPEVLARAEAGDTVALGVVEHAAHALGCALGMVLGLLDPEALIVGGGLGCAPGPYWRALQEQVRGHIWSEQTRRLPILQSSLGPDGALLGAALAAFDLAARPRSP